MLEQKFMVNSKENRPLLIPKIDIVFQSLFNQNNERITKFFVQALLDKKINKLIINEDKELVRKNPQDKLGILDLELDVNSEEKVDVEIQLIDNNNFIERLLFYFSKLYESQIKRGGNYIDAKKVVLIAIIDYSFDLTKNLQELETIWKLFEENHKEILLTNLLEIRILELDKVREIYLKNKNNKKAQWLMILDNPNSKEAKEIMDNNKEIKEAVNEIKRMSEDDKLRRLADLREKALMDEKAYYNTGIIRGIEKNKVDVIKKLYNLHMTLEQISEVVELPIEKIKVILKF